MKKTIGIFSTKQGHQSIAEAIKEKIEREANDRYQVKIFYTKLLLELLFDSIYRFAPSSLKFPYDLSVKIVEKDAELSKLIFYKFFQETYKSSLQFVKKNQIDLAINCYFPFGPTLDKIQNKMAIPHLNIITDPRTIHPWQISPQAQSNFFFDQTAIAHFHKQCQAAISGWFVNDKYEKSYDKEKVKEELKIKEDLVFLIVSGSDGSTAILKILPSLINCPKPLRVFVACGKNSTLYNNIVGIKKSLTLFSQSKAVITPLGFTKDMHLYMQVADLIIGKAGPNTLFESVATLTPFFAITHMVQEEGNLDIIKEKHLGYVEEKAEIANNKILEIINHPEQLKVFQKSLTDLKKYNQQSGKILINKIDQIFQEQETKII